jgi:predicted ATP-binding protein involved in virulence
VEQAAKILLQRHLPYELDMLERALEFVVSDHPLHNDPAAPLLQYMAIETFWTHARNVNEFMKKARNKNPSGIAAARDFTDDVKEIRFSLNEELEDKINEQISHLQYERPETEDGQLVIHDMQRVYPGINSCVREFERRLTPEAKEVWTPRNPKEFVQSIPNASATNVVSSIGWTGPLRPRDEAK